MNWELIGLFLTMIIQVVIPPIPAEVITAVAGRTYGVLTTTIWAGTGLFAGSLLVYAIGRWLRTRLNVFDKQKVTRVLKRISEYETPILWVRILPYNPADIISYAAGIARFDLKKYIMITAVACYVRSFTLAWFGEKISGWWSTAAIAIILVLSAYIGYKVTYGRSKDE